MKRFSLICFCIFFVIVNKLQAQDTINLLSGKQIFPKSIYSDTNSSMLKYDMSFNGKIKQREMDLLNIYSIGYSDKTQKIIYKQDTVLGFDLSEKQMALYIMGEREAMKNHKTLWLTVGGFVVCATATHFLQFWGLITPAVYATAFGIFTPRIHTSPDLSNSITSNNNFLDGYKFYATRKKVKNAILGSIAGVVAYSLTAYTFYQINK